MAYAMFLLAETVGRSIAAPMPLVAHYCYDNAASDNAGWRKMEAIFVIGMHRSGTSMVARVLNMLGCALPGELISPEYGNPLGFWEPKDVVEINSDICNLIDRHWADPKPLAPEWMDNSRLMDIYKRAEEVVARMEGSGQYVVIKDPRMSRLASFWAAIFLSTNVEVKFITCLRNPLDVAASLAKRDGIALDHALQLWTSYMLEAEAQTRGFSSAICRYDDFVDDWRTTLGMLTKDLGINWPIDADKVELAIDGFVAKNQRHFRTTMADLENCPQASSVTNRLFRLLIDEPSLTNKETIDKLHSKWLEAWQVISPGPEPSISDRILEDRQVEMSHNALKNGDVSMAYVNARNAVNISPKNPGHWHHLGEICLISDRLQDAIEAFQSAAAVDPENPGSAQSLFKALSTQVDVLISQGQLEAAVDTLNKIPKEHSGIVDIWKKIGEHAQASGMHAIARTAFSKLNKLDPKRADYLVYLGDAQLNLGEIDKASANVLKASKLQPLSETLHYHLGVLNHKLSNPSAAKSHFQETIKLNPNNTAAMGSLSLVLSDSEEYEEALKVALSAYELDAENTGLQQHIRNLEAIQAQIEDRKSAPMKRQTPGNDK